MSCSGMSDRVSAWVDGIPDAHVESCPNCQREANALREVRTSLLSLATPAHSVGMDARIARRLAARNEPPPVWRWLRFAVLAAACAIVLIVGGGLIRYGVLESAPPPQISFHPGGTEVAANYWTRRIQEAMGGSTR